MPLLVRYPADAKGITYIYGRQSCDTRSMEEGDLDAGNAKFSGQEAMIIFDNVFIPNELIFMHGEYDFSIDVDRTLHMLPQKKPCM